MNIMRYCTWIFIFLIWMTVEVEGWTSQGHTLIGSLAQLHLSDYASVKLKTLLPIEAKGQLSAVANWAAEILVNSTEWSWTAPLHYTYVPKDICAYSAPRDCVSSSGELMACVDGAIRNYSRRASEANRSNEDRGEAIQFLTHFIGDIHSPLHVGWPNDLNGCEINGTFLGSTNLTSLHDIWEESLIEYIVDQNFKGDYNDYLNYLNQLIEGKDETQLSYWLSCPKAPFSNISEFSACSDFWALESSQYACENAYYYTNHSLIVTPFNIDLNYTLYNQDIIHMRLIQAGIRLAAVINSVIGPPPDNDPLEEFALITVLIVIVSVIVGGLILWLYNCFVSWKKWSTSGEKAALIRRNAELMPSVSKAKAKARV